MNIGMWEDHIRAGLGFHIGRARTSPFRVFQTFLSIRPPLPFRDAFYRCVEKTDLGSRTFRQKMQAKFFTGLRHSPCRPMTERLSSSSEPFGMFLRPARRGPRTTVTCSWNLCLFTRSCYLPGGVTTFIPHKASTQAGGAERNRGRWIKRTQTPYAAWDNTSHDFPVAS